MRILIAVIGSLVLLAIAAFCVFGFMATFEPTDRPTESLTFRIGYSVIGIGCLASVVGFVANCIRSSRDAGE